VTAVRVPADVGETAYLKFSRSQEPAPPVVTIATELHRGEDGVESAAIAMNGAGPHPVRLSAAEAELERDRLDDDVIERASEAAREEADPPEDAIASAWYREKMVGTYVQKALEKIATEEST
jgi:CO/xanthine dehydrogenase FAD-binding subunit